MDEALHRFHQEFDESHWWFVGRRRIIAAVLRRHVTRRGGVVVDVGCGAGGLLQVLAPYGTVHGFDVEEGATRLAQLRNPTARVFAADLESGLEHVPRADLLTAFDVIEHLPDDVAAFRAMAGAMNPQGQLCVTVPALPALWSSHDDLNGHHRRYTASSLRTAIERSGFAVEHLSYFNAVLLPVVALARWSERVIGSRSSVSSAGGGGGLVSRLLAATLAAERHVVSRSRVPLGVSLIAVARLRGESSGSDAEGAGGSGEDEQDG